MLGVIGGAISLIAAAYWFLTVAAHRGDPRAVGIVIVAAGLQIALNLAFSGLVAARTGSEFKLNPGGVVIPILVLLALGSSRKVLLELQDRGLWESVFGPAKETAQLCLTGTILIILGLGTLNATTLGIGFKVSQERRIEMQSATAFSQMLSHEERQFLDSLETLGTGFPPEKMRVVSAKMKLLEDRLTQLKAAPSNGKLTPVLATYRSALGQWKEGLTLLQAPNPNTDRAIKLFEAGDQTRRRACEQFNLLYQPPRQRDTAL